MNRYQTYRLIAMQALLKDVELGHALYEIKLDVDKELNLRESLIRNDLENIYKRTDELEKELQAFK